MTNCNLFSLNNILSKSEKYSSINKNNLLQNLSIPHDVFVQRQPIALIEYELPHKIVYKNSASCIDDKLCSEFIKLIGDNSNSSEKHTPKKNRVSKKPKKAKKAKRKTRKKKN